MDANIYELIVMPPDTSKQPQIIRVTGSTPDELIDAAQELANVGNGVNPKPREVRAVVNGLSIAQFMGRWIWDTTGVEPGH